MAAQEDSCQIHMGTRDFFESGELFMPIPLTVVGTDVRGQVFNERTMLLGLQGRNCQYQSKHEVQRDCWVLLDFDYTTAGYKPCRVQGRVKWLRASRTEPRLFHIGVELESSQSVVVVPDSQTVPFGNEDAPALNYPVAATEPKERYVPPPQAKTIAQALSQAPTGPEAATKAKNPEAVAGFEAHILAMISKTEKSPVVTESDQPPGTPQGSLSREMEDSIRAAVTSLVNRIIHDGVERQVTQQYQAAIQALHGDFSHQLTERLAESEQLRACCESIAAMMAERLSRLSQQRLITVEEELNARVTAIRQSAEGVIAQIQGRINDAQASVEDALARAQSVKNEVSDTTARVREALEQVKDADNVAGRLNERLFSRLDTWGAELKMRLDQIIVESTATCVRGMEEQMVPHLRGADERLQTLAAGLQLAQMQQDRLENLSLTTAANCEKQMRAFFLRLSTSV